MIWNYMCNTYFNYITMILLYLHHYYYLQILFIEHLLCANCWSRQITPISCYAQMMKLRFTQWSTYSPIAGEYQRQYLNPGPSPSSLCATLYAPLLNRWPIDQQYPCIKFIRWVSYWQWKTIWLPTQAWDLALILVPGALVQTLQIVSVNAIYPAILASAP